MRRLLLAGWAVLTPVCAPTAYAADPAPIVNPKWETRPSAADMALFYPPRAVSAGVEGTVVLQCKVTPDRLLRDCHTGGETPAGMGFARAAMQTYRLFKLSADTEPGARLDGREVAITMNFRLAVAAAGDGAYAARAIAWLARPSVADLEKARPGPLGAGTAVIRCQTHGPSVPADGALHACVVTSEVPAGVGLGQAALSLAPQFHASPTDFAALGDGGWLVIPFRWPAKPVAGATPPPAPPPAAAFSGSVTGLALIARPVWQAKATYQQVQAAYPKAALDRALPGRVLLECVVATDAGLKDCRVLEESPLGQGFGEAGLSLAPLFQASPRLAGGQPVEAAVRLGIAFTPPGG